MKTYAQLLRDPRWQRKRLEIMERDNYTCRRCEATDKTLNVHHTYYEKGLMPWQYPNGSLYTFCEDCHKAEGAHKTEWDWKFVETFRRAGATNATLERLVYIMQDLAKEYGFGRLSLLEAILSEQQDRDGRLAPLKELCVEHRAPCEGGRA